MDPKTSKIEPMQLMQYGLNPFQWILLEENSDSAEFMHIDDPELRVIAEFNFDPKLGVNKFQISQLAWGT